MQHYLKLINFILLAVVGTVGVDLFSGGGLTWNTAVVALGALLLWWKENTPSQPLAKEAVAVATAAGVVLVSAWKGDQFLSQEEVVQIVLAGLGAFQAVLVKQEPLKG